MQINITCACCHEKIRPSNFEDHAILGSIEDVLLQAGQIVPQRFEVGVRASAVQVHEATPIVHGVLSSHDCKKDARTREKRRAACEANQFYPALHAIEILILTYWYWHTDIDIMILTYWYRHNDIDILIMTYWYRHNDIDILILTYWHIDI